MQDIRIKLIELESRREQLNYKRKSGKDTSAELKSRQQKIKDEITQLKAEEMQLKKDTIGEGDYVLEKRLSDMEKRFEAMNKNTDKKKKMPKACGRARAWTAEHLQLLESTLKGS